MPGIQTREQVQVSSPSDIYDRLLLPRAEQCSMAIRGLVVMLGVEYSNTEFTPWLGQEISSAMNNHETAILRAPMSTSTQVGKHLIHLAHRYPWLQEIVGPPIHARDEAIHARSVIAWASRRTFNNYPGMFGITPKEANIFSGHCRGTTPKQLATELGIRP